MSSPDVSIVSGTYNRRAFLEGMVNSVRHSFAGVSGISVEVIIVDGGSRDGTLDWVREQPDCRLIEHGTLLGAVKAFNDGAMAARGQYVVMANDDIEFIGDALPRAWAYMQAHPDCGVGCFYQDRNRQTMDDADPGKWHVEFMPAVERVGPGDWRPVHVVYGQVCIVPKALGDRVGWWGDYLRTYGGDNELSANVYEAGYKVSPMDGCRIHDNEPKDDLRRINNVSGGKDPRAVRGYHPDSWAWGQKWTKRWRQSGYKNLGGPELQESPRFPISIQQKERIVYLPIYERGWEIQKRQKRGLREALARIGAVVEIDHVGYDDKDQLRGDFIEACRRIQPTIILCQFHGEDPIDVSQMRAYAPGAWWVAWNGDYWPDNLLSEKGVKLARSFDLMTSVNREVVEKYQGMGVNAAYWQIGWEPDGRGHEPGKEDRCDIVFLANGYSADRQKFVAQLRGLPYSFRLWGNGWKDSVGQCTYDFITACKAYRGAKFSIGDSQWPESGFVSNRVMQALAAGGSALCHQWFRGMENLGLVDGETCIVWWEFGELAHRLAWYAAHESERARIATAGEKLALERHSFDTRVSELLEWKPGGSEDWR